MSADSQFREKVRQAIQAVAEVFGDTTVAVSTTREGLGSLGISPPATLIARAYTRSNVQAGA